MGKSGTSIKNELIKKKKKKKKKKKTFRSLEKLQ